MDLTTIFTWGIIGLILIAVIITRISQAQIERKAILRDISDAVMDFDKIDALKKKNLPLKYFAKLQAAEQQTIEVKLVASESVNDLFFLCERAQSLTSKSLRKKIEEILIQAIGVRLKYLINLPAPDQTGKILKELHVFEKALKNITAPEIEKKIYALKKKHMGKSEVAQEGIERLAETS